MQDIIKYLDIVEKILVVIVSMSMLAKFAIYTFDKNANSVGIVNNVSKMILFVFAFGIICVLNKWNIPHEIVKTYLILIVIILVLTIIIILIKKIEFKNRLNDYRDPVTGKIDKELFEQDNFYKSNKLIYIFLGFMFIIVLIVKIIS